MQSRLIDVFPLVCNYVRKTRIPYALTKTPFTALGEQRNSSRSHFQDWLLELRRHRPLQKNVLMNKKDIKFPVFLSKAWVCSLNTQPDRAAGQELLFQHYSGLKSQTTNWNVIY